METLTKESAHIMDLKARIVLPTNKGFLRRAFAPNESEIVCKMCLEKMENFGKVEVRSDLSQVRFV